MGIKDTIDILRMGKRAEMYGEGYQMALDDVERAVLGTEGLIAELEKRIKGCEDAIFSEEMSNFRDNQRIEWLKNNIAEYQAQIGALKDGV